MSALAGLGLGYARELAGPMIQQSLSDFRQAAGYNDMAQARAVMYRQQYGSTLESLSDNFTPFRFSLGQALTIFNQGPWPRADRDQDLQRRLWRKLRDNLRYAGINMALPGDAQILSTNETAPTPEAVEWLRLVSMSSAAAPLGQTIRDYYRSIPLENDRKAVTQDDLNFELQRGQYRRKQDRQRLLEPFYGFSVQEAIRLARMGAVDLATFLSLLEANGIVRPEDKGYIDYLRLVIPDPQALVLWASRRLWDQGIADQYKLDDDFDKSPIAQFFSQRTAGNAPGVLIPGQPDGETNWIKLAYRASRPLPNFQLALEMQHRLRPDEPGSLNSVIAGVAPWTEDNTRDMLTVAGYTEPVIDRLMGLVDQPINVRIINTVLLEALKHDDVSALAEEAFGRGYDWVKAAYLDHGFSDDVASLAAAGIRAKARDEADAEKIEGQKRIRADARKAVIRRYEIGLLTYDQATIAMQDKFFDESMAAAELAPIRQALDDQVIMAGVKALHAAWMEGKMVAPGIEAGLKQIGISDEQRQRYISEWTWERTEKVRVAQTGEILAALKAGLFTPAQAQARMVNLGWSAPDAILEIALVEQSLTAAAAKANAVALERESKEAIAQRKALEQAAAKRALIVAKQDKQAAKTSLDVLLASHKAIADQSTYLAAVHEANKKYATAEKKGDTETQAAELAKELAAYETYLTRLIELAGQGPEVAHEISSIDASPAPGPDQSKAAPGGSSSPDSSGG